MRSQTLGINFYLKQWLPKGKKGMREIQKYGYRENKAKLLDEIKSIFVIFLRATIC